MNAKDFEAMKLPEKIKEAKEKHQTILEEMPANKKLIAEAELAALSQATGKNPDERKVSCKGILDENKEYQNALKQKERIENEAARAAIEVEYQKDRKDNARTLAMLAQED